VISGTYEGDTGLIVRVEDREAVLFSDLTMHEMRVRPSDLQLCTEMATGVDSLGQFSFGDLVQIDSTTVGVIVRLERESFQVLTNKGKVERYKQAAVTKKREHRRAVALDSDHNDISCKDIVKVVDGPHSGRQGEIKHLYRNFGFLYSRLMTENGGIFVCKTRHLTLAGGSKTSSTTSTGGFAPMSPRLSSPAHPSQGAAGLTPQAGRGRGQGMRRDTGMIGHTVRIVQGPFKGYVGIVKDAAENLARVELHTNCKTISVDMSRLRSVNGSRVGAASTRFPDRTPVAGANMTPSYGGATPMYGSQTPQYDGSRTPAYTGSQTPIHEPGSSTPRSGGAWDPTVSNTPSRSNDFDYMEDSPDSYNNPSTPGYNPGDTPSPQGPFTPRTPGSDYGGYSQALQSPGGSFQGGSPSPISGFGSTPSPNSLMGQAPSPGSFTGTPSPVGYSPMTPGQPFTPQTPGPGSEFGSNDWVLNGIEAKISESFDDESLIHQIGIIRNASESMCTLYIPEVDRTISIASEHLQPVRPAAGDHVKVILGPNRDIECELSSFDGEDAIVKTGYDEMLIIPLDYLCRMPNE